MDVNLQQRSSHSNGQTHDNSRASQQERRRQKGVGVLSRLLYKLLSNVGHTGECNLLKWCVVAASRALFCLCLGLRLCLCLCLELAHVHLSRRCGRSINRHTE